ncbi:MAG: protein kinase [Bacteroidales bacterium]
MPEKISHYRIIEELGKGGMGVVYKAEDERLDRVVALKVLAPHYAEDPAARKRFIREARVASSLQHQHICTIHEIDETAEGQLFISMDYYEGETLLQKILQGLPTLEIILDYAIQITEGLAAAHSRGIIHRDIKPGNIMITREGVVKILDFGLAKLTGKYDSTHTGKALGSVSYISPEQAQGTRVDHLTDIWSFGVVLYEMSTGVLPFAHEYDAAVIYSILDKSPVPPTEINEDLPEALETLIYRCLRKNKEERIQSAEEIRKELVQILESPGNKVSEKKQIRKKQAERRMVTILIAEVSNYQELVSRMDEEEADGIIQHCSEIIDSVAGKFGGILTNSMDQTSTILFGMAGQGENAPVQAVNTAIEISERIQHLNNTDQPDPPVTLRLGINTGPAIVKVSSVHGTEEYSVTGETLVQTHEIKALSSGGKILVGPLTYRFTSRLFDFIPVKGLSRAGSTEQVKVYELQSTEIRDIRKTIRLNGLIQSEIVGREKELDQLHYYLLKLIQGEGFIINVIGEAGVGKSRLIAEFLRKKEINRVEVLEGRALSSGENLSFYPIIGLIKSMVGIKESEEEKESQQKLEESIQRICSGEANEVFPFIATLMGMELTGEHAERLKGLEGEGLEKLILKNLRTLVAMASDRKPLVMVVEDLHWADQSSLRLLKSLYRLAENHPILFINVFRPDYRETGEMMLAAVRDRFEKNHAEINLHPLNEQESELFINRLLKTTTVQGRTRALIFERAEGNPLYLEELVRSMIDEGSISVHEGSVSISKDTGSLAVPGTLHEVLMARIDRLDEDSRSLIRTASVIGRHFFRKVLCEVSGNVPDIDRILDHLKQIQLIRESRRMEEVEYLFRHALIQQAAYDTILTRQRKELHLKVARAIETVFSDRIHDFYGILAYHYSLGEDPDHFEKYLIHAGEQALRSSASFEALHYFREALTVYLERHGDRADPQKIAMLHKNIGIAHFNSGHFIETDLYLEKALALYGFRIPKNPLLLYSRVIYGLAVFLFRIWFPSTMGRRIPTEQDREINDLILRKGESLSITESMRFVMEMLLAAPRLTRYRMGNPEAVLRVGAVFTMTGFSFTIGQKTYDYAANHAHEYDQRYQVATAFMFSFHHLVSGNWKDDTYDPKLTEIGTQAGYLYDTNSYIAMMVHIYAELGYRTAGKIFEKLDQFAEIFEYDYGRLAKYSHGSLYLYKFGEFEKAATLADEGITFMNRTLGNKPGTLMIYSMKIKALIHLERLTEAEESLKMAHDFSRQEKLVPYFHSFLLTAKLLFETRKMEEALQKGDNTGEDLYRKRIRKSAKKAVRISKKVAFERVECYRLTGIYYWLLGKQARALRWWAKALREAESLGAKIEWAITLKEAARRLSEPGSRYRALNGESAAALNDRADFMYKEMEIESR